MNEAYREQVRLMLDLLPFIAEESIFALKGGTAINFFVRDMPRLSVDIDLTYLPLEDRAAPHRWRVSRQGWPESKLRPNAGCRAPG